LALKRFGKKVRLNGLLGDDAIGRLAMEQLNDRGLAEGMTTTDREGTAFSIVIAPPGVDRLFLESAGCNKIFDTSFVDFEAASRSRVFHFGYPPLLRRFFLNDGEQLVGLFRRLQACGVATSLDFSLPDPGGESGRVDWPKVLRLVLPHTDLFVPSLEELLQIMAPTRRGEHKGRVTGVGPSDESTLDFIRKIGRQLIDSGLPVLLVKAGHEGAYLLTGDVSALKDRLQAGLDVKAWNHREAWCAACRADDSRVLNTCGAGDTAAAAFVAAILEGEDPECAMRYAAVAGRDRLYCRDGCSELGDWQTLTQAIESEPSEVTFFRE
jgi:sugar/nucleoside kinase (ribokinase family)